MTVKELKELLELIPDGVEIMMPGSLGRLAEIADIIAIYDNSKIRPGWSSDSAFAGKVYIRSKTEASGI